MGEKLSVLWQIVADYIFPKRCIFCDKVIGFTACKACDTIKNKYLRFGFVDIYGMENQNKNLDNICAPFWYIDNIKSTIINTKYNGAVYHVPQLVNYMLNSIKQNISTNYTVVVCVPTTVLEHKKRDNIPHMLAQLIAKDLNVPFDNYSLIKIKETMRQSELSGEERLENVKNAFDVVKPNAFINQKVLLVDDIITTGSTANECAKIIKSSGAILCDCVCIATTKANK